MDGGLEMAIVGAAEHALPMGGLRDGASGSESAPRGWGWGLL